MPTILILDDDKYFRQLARAALDARGHTVLEAATCAEADALLANDSSPDAPQRALVTRRWEEAVSAACDSRVSRFERERDRLRRSTSCLDPIDLVLVDGLLPDSDGVSWIERLRRRDEKTAVLFISAFSKNDPRLKRLPISGHLRKPIDPGTLAAKVENALRAAGIAPEMTVESESALAALREVYQRDLPGLLTGVRVAVEQLRLNPSNAALRGIARRRAHQVAGAAGSFGFAAVGDACAEIEQGLESREWKNIDSALQLLEPAPQRAVA